MYVGGFLLFLLLLSIQPGVSFACDCSSSSRNWWYTFRPEDCDRLQGVYQEIHREEAQWKSTPIWDEFHVNASSSRNVPGDTSRVNPVEIDTHLNLSSVLHMYGSLVREIHQVERESGFRQMDPFVDLQSKLRLVQTERRKQWFQSLLYIELFPPVSEMKQEFNDLWATAQAVDEAIQNNPTEEQIASQKRQLEKLVQKYEQEQHKRYVADIFLFISQVVLMVFIGLGMRFLDRELHVGEWIHQQEERLKQWMVRLEDCVFRVCKKRSKIEDDQESVWEEEWFDVPERKQLEPFICPICQNILREPQQSSKCGHVFCKSCIRHWLKQASTCPLDQKYISMSDLFPDGRVHREISQLPIRCCFHPTKCKFRHPQVGDGSAWKKHARTCKFGPKSQGHGRLVQK